MWGKREGVGGGGMGSTRQDWTSGVLVGNDGGVPGWRTSAPAAGRFLSDTVHHTAAGWGWPRLAVW
jgi:hypothetical protein